MASSALSAFLKFHQAVYEKTDGAIGHRMIGVPTLLLRTTGRKSGQTRCSALVYAEDNGRYIVVASKGGDPVSPGWFFNAQANSDVEIQLGRKRRKAKAEVIAQGDADYDRLWRLVNQKNRNRYDAYQKLTDRPIPLLALTPTD